MRERESFFSTKKEKLSYKIECGVQRISDNQAYFVISTNLTQKGVQEYKRVVSKVYEAINGLKKEGIAKHLYDEVSTIGKSSPMSTRHKAIFLNLC